MVNRKVLVFIPAHMGSKRLPGKCMCKIGNFPLVCWTYVQARMSGYVAMVVTPDTEISEALSDDRRIPCLLTSNDPRNGSERCGEAMANKIFDTLGDEDIIIDVQGDMVKFDYACIRNIVHLLSVGKAEYATTFTKLLNGTASNTNRVKCTIRGGSDRGVLWVDDFSRNIIVGRENYLHIGIYGYTKRALNRYCEWKMTENERVTKLEQMRIIDNGYKIAGVVSDTVPITIDCAEDVYWAEKEVQNLDCFLPK